MALIYADRVKETSATIGTGTFTLVGAVDKFRTFNAGIGVGNEVYYVAVNDVDNSWEVGKGTVQTTTTLSRDLVISSSNSNLLVSFLVGTKTIAAVAPSTFFTATLNTASHALINHTGLPGVPGPETFTSIVHQGVNHTVPPFNLLDAAVHAAIDHKLAPFNLLDSAAHAGINHSGLPGIPVIPTNTTTTLFTSATDATASSLSPTTLHSYTVTPSQFATDGDELVIEGWVRIGLVQSGLVTLSFGGITIFTRSQSASGREFNYEIRIIRKGSNSQLVKAQLWLEDSVTLGQPNTPVATQAWYPRAVASIPTFAADLTVNATIQIVGQAQGTAGNAVQSRFFAVRKIPA